LFSIPVFFFVALYPSVLFSILSFFSGLHGRSDCEASETGSSGLGYRLAGSGVSGRGSQIGHNNSRLQSGCRPDHMRGSATSMTRVFETSFFWTLSRIAGGLAAPA